MLMYERKANWVARLAQIRIRLETWCGIGVSVSERPQGRESVHQ